MAAYRTDGVTFNTTAGVKTVVITSATSDLFVVLGGETGVTTTPTLTDNQTGGTYTLVRGALKNASADKCFIWVRDNLFASAVSTTVTFTPSGDTGGGINVIAVSGMSRAGLSAIRQSGIQENGVSSTPAPTFDTGVALTQNMIIGVLLSATNTGAPTNYTQRQSVNYTSPSTRLQSETRDSGETTNQVSWTTTAAAYGDIIVELDTSAVLTPSLLPRRNPMVAHLGR